MRGLDAALPAGVQPACTVVTWFSGVWGRNRGCPFAGVSGVSGRDLALLAMSLLFAPGEAQSPGDPSCDTPSAWSRRVIIESCASSSSSLPLMLSLSSASFCEVSPPLSGFGVVGRPEGFRVRYRPHGLALGCRPTPRLSRDDGGRRAY